MIEIMVVVGLALIASGLCSVLEAVLLSVPASHVAILRRRGRAGTWLWNMRQNLDEPVAAILTLNTISHTVGAAVAGALALELFGSDWMAAFSIALTLAILLFSEILPKTLGARHARVLAVPAAAVLMGLRFVLRPFLIPLAWFSRLLSGRGDDTPTVSRAELEVLAEIGRQEGTIDDDEWRIVTRAMRLHRVRVDQVMVPRNQIAALSAETSVEQARLEMFAHGRFRLPVYREDIDSIVGIVTAGDLADPAPEAMVGDLARPVLYLPGTVPVDDAIARLRDANQKMAIVLDEFGGCAGLVTMDDLLEEIVGGITDRSGGRPFIERIGGARLELDGGTPLRELEQELGIRFDDKVSRTVSGLLLRRLGRVPAPGEVVRGEGYELVVTEADRLRVRRVELRLEVPE